MRQPNQSVLRCPQCQKSLVNIASRVERIHPIAVFIKNHNFTIFGIWSVVVTMLLFGGFLGENRNTVHGWLILLIAPSVIMYFLVKLFNVYRITDCPYCDFHEKQKLGRSNTH